ncbi:Xaa-Pro aminopeptidase [Halorubrum ezzemoulense]|jgi:Xaa-Pro aminopeptidase|uniref:Xaa-Pro aminopeptidase n=1 Tax=Halorubrum ezzemoulense TaxID=337243 RepID=A0A238UYZ3_HALEZ|nr:MULTISPECIES: Xaa-Pro peptidase family protein [Halorubrum]MDB2263138.1 Xaa-Pro peptidase family protein [Halorubrum ezzemoulense]TKX41830.1 aminopeptidase P family protein [Halorubrum sp. CGM4_25_10-8A]SNR27141.1 Xaa-Pro aminopeptidase [Halorubrum ezzemoulense]
MATRLPESAFDDRLAAVRDRLADTDADAATWVGATAIEYLTGFHHIQTERPVVLAVTDDRVEITVPRLEVERVEPNPRIDAVHHYFDYPGGEPVSVAVEMLRDLGAETIAADADGPPGVMGYEGPAFSDSVDVRAQAWVDRMRWAKSDAEVDLIRESAKWANLGHRYLADFSEPGAHPATVSQRASTEASRAMLDALGDAYSVRVRGDGPVHAGYISGEETALPHGHTPNERLSEGDVLVTGATANVDGYRSELERTMFVGDYTDEQEHYFELMLEAQTLAIDALGPGVPVAEVDRVVWDYLEEQGVTDLAQHHVGHNIGLGAHEPPYIDRGWDERYDGDDAVMAPGHVYTIEPGLYTDEYGYRHSDTVAITESGTERLTNFPRDIDSNVV